MNSFVLYDARRRKNITEFERLDFLRAARRVEGSIRTLAETLAYTVCRFSEPLALTAEHIAIDSREIRIAAPEKESRTSGRPVPVPGDLIEHLDLVHNIRRQQSRSNSFDCPPL